MPLSSLFKQTEELLDEVFRAIREEYDHPYSVLCETDRNKFLDEEEILREQLKETVESESNSCQWRSFLGLPSPQAAKCLKDAEALQRRVKEDIKAKLRTRLSGKSNPPPSASHEQGSAFNLMGARTPETDTGRPLADANPEPASAMITSPLNMSCSSPEASEVILYPAAQNDDDYTSDLNEAINTPVTPLETSSDQSRDSSIRRHRRPPPPVPVPRRIPQSSDSETTSSNPGITSPRRSHSVRRPAPPPPQSTRRSRTPGSPINGYLPSPGPLSPNPAMMSSISEFNQHVNKLVSSIVTDDVFRQAQGRRGLRCSEEYVIKTNCMDINDSNVDGVTLNNGGYNNSGAVIHKTILPPRPPQPVPQV